jgi:hypothetical protein
MIRLLLCIALLAGCSLPSAPPPRPQPPPWQYYPLLPPASYGGSVELDQRLEGEFRAQRFALHVRLEIDATRLLVVGFTPFQTRAFMLHYDGKTLAFENLTGHSMPFPPAVMLSDIQQVMWPLLPSRQGWHVENNALARVRQVFFGNQLVTQIQYNELSPREGDSLLSNMTYGYQLRIRSATIPTN